MKFLTIGFISVASLVFITGSASALSISSARDCDDNAILRCGALTTAELSSKYQSSGMGPVYARFGITGTEIANMDSGANASEVVEAGEITSNNTVTLNGRVIATDAVTAGRQDIAGSTKESSGGITFYQRPPSVSFASSTLPAFVVLENSRFSFAIIASCGNPVKATPTVSTAAASPAPAPTAPKPVVRPATTPTIAPQPNITITNTNTQSQSQSQAQGGMGGGEQPSAAAAAPSQSGTAQSTAAASVTPTASSAAPKALPNTGPGPLLGLSGATSFVATAGHMIFRRSKKA